MRTTSLNIEQPSPPVPPPGREFAEGGVSVVVPWAILLVLLGFASLAYGIFLLFGTGWMLLVLAAHCYALVALLFRGLLFVSAPPARPPPPN